MEVILSAVVNESLIGGAGGGMSGGRDGHDLQVYFIPLKFDCFIVRYIELELCHRCCPWLCLNYS